LRARVLKATDGIVSTVGGVATTAKQVILTAGVADAVSTALGEYASVSTQRATQRAILQKEREEA
jgi:vacuolar iron transporter family protein